MKNLFMRLALAAVLGSLLTSIQPVRAQGTAFTYQGRLNTNAVPADGFFDFQFALSNAPGGGSQIGSTLTITDVGVTNGLFTVTLNFGDYFTGNSVWLAISVRSNNVGSYTAMTPLQELNPTPYAIFANTSSNVSGTLSATQITGTLPLAQLPPGLVTNDENGVTLSNVTVQGNLNLPSPAVIDSGGTSLLYADGQDNFFAGLDSGNVPLSGYYNTVVGDDALTSITSGNYNTANGYEALEANTTGEINTGIGVQALWNNTTGIFNTGIGVDALYPNTTGSYNTALGVNALAGSTGGSNNIGIGYGAGQSLNGNSNIDIGHPGVSSDNMTIRIGSGQTATYLAGVIYGNGAGLTNVGGLLSDPGSLNFFAGPNAGNATLSGEDNVGVGSYTLTDITTGDYNTAVGVGSLEDNNMGSYNTAIGDDAMAFNTTGNNNTAVGVSAMVFSSTGYNNTATGYEALLFSSSGYNNTATGISALGGASVTGDANTGTGGLALQYLTTGYNNTAAGYSALQANTTGVDNVGIGVNALVASQTGAENTAIGTYTLVNLTNGSLNTAIGLDAGYYLYSGSDNIYIGNYGAATDNNVIRIGESQTETFISSWNGAFISGSIALDGSDTDNGLVYSATAPYANPVWGSDGVFLYGFDGGALGTVGPNEISLSWDFNGNVWISNNCSMASLSIRGGSDLAEPFKITSDKNESPEGSVVVIDEANPGHLKVSSQPYDTRVAGILSGANGIHAGIQMHQEGLLEGDRNVALTGRVYVQADASNGPIKPGDLLTTSSTPGRAMKVTDHVRAQGAILGKAMSGLSEGNGMVLVLVTLQ